MDTRTAATLVRVEEWKQIIRECKESGMTIEDYCKNQRISKNQYYYWLRKIRRNVIVEHPAVFAELVPPANDSIPTAYSGNVSSPSIEISNSDGVKVCIYEGASKELLQMALEVIHCAQ